MKRTTDKQRDEFWGQALEPINGWPLPVVDAVKLFLQVEDDVEWVVDWVEENFDPEDVFSDERLAAWAERNGWGVA